MNRIKITHLLLSLFLVGMLFMTVSCEDDVDQDSMYTFKTKTMGQYIEEEESLSDFATILQRTNVMGLLKSYGVYTCFAPDNKALQRYYEKKGKSSLDDFNEYELKQIAFDHLVSGDTIPSGYFGEGRLNQMTMSDRFLSISYSGSNIIVNSTSVIFEKDIMVHNGVIHLISEVIDPARYGIVVAILGDDKFSLFADALLATGLAELLQKDQDETYDPNLYTDLIKYPKETNPAWRYDDIPWIKRYGYTVFMESNETFQRNGINNIEDLKAYAAKVYDKVYPEDAGITDITNRKNSLNRFIAYHLVDKELSIDKLIDAYDNNNVIKIYDMYEYIETMCPNTLIEVKKDRQLDETNLLNFISETGRAIRLTDDYDNEAKNGIYHEIDDILVYDEDVLADHSSKRLRMDMASMFPEFTNNNIRGQKHTLPCLHMWFPHGYIERLDASEQTTLGYVGSNERLMNYQGDELFMDVATGNLYEFTITTPPIPKGVYEVRMGYLSNGGRGVCQFYFDGTPTGVPINLNNQGDHESIGWVQPGTVLSDPYGYENDKMMRNLGYMKAPACIAAPDKTWTSSSNAREDKRVLRNILGIYTFDEAGHHTLSVKGLSGGQFMLDYLEFIPTSAIESEDIN
ncbi:fasciclin domain-containing protein [Bacteroidales bacterium OttesenSCG-928-J19]|nr:fasciclin domain-containing protein [Bacteroidales bacterium OttesenSCG-928-J19]